MAGGGEASGSLFPSFLRGDKNIAMLELYIDESGSHNKRLLVVGGFVGNSSQWEDFTKSAAEIRREFSIPYFHAKDLRNGHSAIYKDLTETRRKDLLETLTREAVRASQFGVFAFISPAEFERATSKRWRERHGSAYRCAIQTLIYYLWQRMTDSGKVPTKLTVALEAGHVNARDAYDSLLLYKKETDPFSDPAIIAQLGPEQVGQRGSALLLDGVLLSDKINMPALWSADLLAFFAHGYITYPRDPYYRGALGEIYRSVEVKGFEIDRSQIEEYAEAADQMDLKIKEFKAATHAKAKALKPLGIYPTKHAVGIEWKVRLPTLLVDPFRRE